MKALLRRTAGEESGSELKVGDLVLEIDSRRVVLEDKRLEMGPTEFKLLHFFMSHPERAYSRAQLLDQVWGTNVYVEERTVDVHIRRLERHCRHAMLLRRAYPDSARNGLSVFPT